MGLLAAILLLASTVPPDASAPPHPVCSKATAGRFYPEAANSDPALSRTLTRRGELEICTHAEWGYRWRSPTVDVKQLRKSR